MLAGKKILLAVSGSIAAYKSALIVRLCIKEQAEVRIIMTESAKKFVTPTTLSTLSKHPVYSSFYKDNSEDWHNHVALGLWADLLIIAPASAHTLSKMAHGLCDNFLLSVFLSARCPVYFAPAMDLDMLAHSATQKNIDLLVSRGNHLITSDVGELASGLNGKGRMAAPETIVNILREHFKTGIFSNKKVLITSGPTYETFDSVRFIGNHSSGKMGYALALLFAKKGAQVVFISGPVKNYPKHPHIEVIKVTSADEMLETCKNQYLDINFAIFAAAVADYKPSMPFDKKHKKDGNPLNITLIENPDIAQELGKLKDETQIHVGFALETHDGEASAKEKIKRKNLNLIVLNSLEDPGVGFGQDTNKITIYDRFEKKFPFELKDKKEVAQDIVKIIQSYA
ncbi:MAG: bifunctional phosphopantothenoylcysteine decarboxylase/phosphopantothenate--cysteine ligase CoaBC [Flammeovirgaceae bacterium]|nr:bifunctional phosphopantothenoylcysteine decarboxylase/phosphopantothenate--cysteine ligase CoaBC [Flammeovirgaceae bacterium]